MAGIWRMFRIFDAAGIPVTFFGCAFSRLGRVTVRIPFSYAAWTCSALADSGTVTERVRVRGTVQVRVKAQAREQPGLQAMATA